MIENEISYKIIGAAIEVHRLIGPGVFESAYELPFIYELEHCGLSVQRQVQIPLIYKQIKIECAYKVDFIIEDKVIVEIKSLQSLAPVNFTQVLTYLRLTELKLGLLINFNSNVLKDGVHRIVNNL